MQTLIQRAAKSNRTKLRNKFKNSTRAYLAGFWTGGIVPTLTYAVAHFQAPDLFIQPWGPKEALWLVVIGGLTYSAPMVAAWFSRYVGNIKAWGFVLSLEVTLTFTEQITAIPALVTLICINGLILADKFGND